MSHEQSETIQGPDGLWYNVYGKATPLSGYLLPGEQTGYPSVKPAVQSADRRSDSHGAGPLSAGAMALGATRGVPLSVLLERLADPRTRAEMENRRGPVPSDYDDAVRQGSGALLERMGEEGKGPLPGTRPYLPTTLSDGAAIHEQVGTDTERWPEHFSRPEVPRPGEGTTEREQGIVDETDAIYDKLHAWLRQGAPAPVAG